MRQWSYPLVTLALVVLACGSPTIQTSPSPTAPVGQTPSATASVLPTPTALPTEKPVDESPPASGLPAYLCQAQSGGVEKAEIPANVLRDVRTGRHDSEGFDRFVMEFTSPNWTYVVTPQSNVFTRDPSGLQVTLQGTAGLRVVVRNTVNHNDQGQPVETVLNSVPDYRVLKQTTQLGDFEGIVTWGLGIARPNCFRAFVLTGPDRLVVDVQH
jgi:hypothetical protein